MKKSSYLFNLIIFALSTMLAPTSSAIDRVQPGTVNLQSLYQAIEKAKLDQKGEEETTAAFKERRARFRFHNQILGDEMIVRFRPAAAASCNTTIDADSATIGFACSARAILDGENGHAIVTNESNRLVGTYPAANAFNRQVTVTEREIVRFAVLARTPPGGSGDRPISAQLKMSNIPGTPGKLRKDLERLEVAVVFKARPPFISQSIEDRSPTVDDPYDISIRTKSVVAFVYRLEAYRAGDPEPILTYRVVPRKVSNNRSAYEIVLENDTDIVTPAT